MFVITGGGSGIGAALAHALAKRTHEVLIIGRNISNLKSVATAHRNIEYFCADLAKQDDRLLLTQQLHNKKITALINNAGIIEPIAKIMNIKLAAWRQIMAINVEAPLFLVQLLKDNLTDGRVLNIGSGAANFSTLGWAPYCVSKAALYRLTESFKVEELNIAFASVKPGIIDTNMQKMIREASNMDTDKHDFFKKLYAGKKLIQPEVVASFLVWLLLDVNVIEYQAQEWDIYDKKHHKYWLKETQIIPDFE